MSPPPDHAHKGESPFQGEPPRARRHSAPTPKAQDAPAAGDRTTHLAHELRNLLDASMRGLGVAMRALDGPRVEAEKAQIDAARRQIGLVLTAMERMCELVRVAMQSTPGSLGSASMGLTSPLSLAAALTHAVEVLGPLASDHRVMVDVRVSPEIEAAGAGPVYTVVFNAVRNSIESIARTGRPGHVLVRAAIRGQERTGRWVQIEVRDDGEGPPMDRPSTSLFEFGVTTKRGGSGIGLALAAEIVREMGGVIELLPAVPHAPAGHRGAVLTVAYPLASAAAAGGGGT